MAIRKRFGFVSDKTDWYAVIMGIASVGLVVLAVLIFVKVNKCCGGSKKSNNNLQARSTRAFHETGKRNLAKYSAGNTSENAGAGCVAEPGYDPYDAPCCSGNSYTKMTKITGPGGTYCIGGDPTECQMNCTEACTGDGPIPYGPPGSLNEPCYTSCTKLC